MSTPHGFVGRDLATGDSLSPETPLDVLAERVLATSIAKGFEPPAWGPGGNYLAKLMLVITEIDEAITSAHTRDELRLELADIAIRILGILRACHASEQPNYGRIESRAGLRPHPNFAATGVWQPPAEAFWSVVQYIVRAAECWRTDDRGDACLSLEFALLETFRIADRCGIDLMAAIVEKDTKNQEREYRHGKKASG